MKKIFYIVFIACVFAACSEDVTLFGDNTSKKVISISAEYPVVVQTRATDNGFTSNDKVGVFVVDYEGENAGVMALSGNRASNVMLTYDETVGKWSAPMTLYWATDGTPADIIGYYPFVENLESTIAQPFTIRRDQNGSATETAKGGYEQSDWLWAKATKVSPTSETISLKYQHVMAGLNIRLERGDGFTVEEWAQMEKTVLVTNTQLNGFVDLTTGTATLNPQSSIFNSITALTYGDAWRVVVLPQTIEAGKALIIITVDGQNYQLTKSEIMSYLAGKMHNFTIEVNRRTAGGDFEFKLLDEAIVPWEVDAVIHDGLTRTYAVVNVIEPGTLQQQIANKGLDYKDISNLKVVGPINYDDMFFMGQKMMSLTNLNLRDAMIPSGTITGFISNMTLSHIIFPQKGLKKIGFMAFAYSGLQGNLIIPEGVEIIAPCAFQNCCFGGNLSLPTTLKHLYFDAIWSCGFTGELLLPDKMDFRDVGEYQLDSNDYPYEVYLELMGWDHNGMDLDFSGQLNLPSGLTKLVAFLGFPNMKGNIIIPQGVKTLDGWNNLGTFEGGGYDGIISLPEGVETIGPQCFANTKITGEVLFPSTLESISQKAFLNTRIRKIVFNDKISTIDEQCFRDCSYLSGKVIWPKNCTRVSENVFENCSMLSGIVLHKDVKVIADGAFLRCVNLTSIVCESEEPPLVGDDAFLGVSKWNTIVEVPASAVEKYRNAEGWSEFKRIVAQNDFDCQPQNICALNKVHEEDLVLYSDGPWTIEYQPNWINLSKNNGTGKSDISITINQLGHGQGNRTDSIVFRHTNEGYTTYCKISQYDYQYDEDASITLQQHSRGNGIDIVFVGDGWNAQSISNGSYLDLVEYQTECFFAIEPYRSMRNYFNVHVTFPLSQENGVNTMYTYVNNKFGTLNGESSLSSGCTSSQLITESDEVMNYVQSHVSCSNPLNKTLVVLVPNTTDYGGNTILMEDGRTLSICPPSENAYPRDTRGTIQHEAGGHGFGKLGDEIITRNAFAGDDKKQEIEEMHGRGWYANLATTGKLHEVPWAEFIFDPMYSDRVDVYEGGYGFTRGIYRSEANSCMNYGIPYYNTPSRLAIWKRIKELAGEGWTMEEFRAQDTFEWGPSAVTRSSNLTTPQWDNIKPGMGYAESNRHVRPCIVNFKKMGNEVRAIRNKIKNEITKNRR